MEGNWRGQWSQYSPIILTSSCCHEDCHLTEYGMNQQQQEDETYEEEKEKRVSALEVILMDCCS
jgi:hypothetical protein